MIHTDRENNEVKLNGWKRNHTILTDRLNYYISWHIVHGIRTGGKTVATLPTDDNNTLRIYAVTAVALCDGWQCYVGNYQIRVSNEMNA